MTAADRFIEWWEETPCLPAPAPDQLRAHLIEHHAVPDSVLDAHEPAEHAVWHRAEHDRRHPGGRPPHNVSHAGHLAHTHPKWLPAAAKAQEKAA